MRWRVTLWSNGDSVVCRLHDSEASARQDYADHVAKLDSDPIYWADYRVTFEQQTWVQ